MEDFYAPAQKEAEQRSFARFLTAGIALILAGVVAHARYRISSGKVEGTNNMIKSLRRAGYGYPDDEYFFLKIFDSSRRYSPGRESVAA